jgi:hypothetical protein
LLKARQHYSSKKAQGSATALPVKKQWVWVAGVVLFLLFVIIGHEIFREGVNNAIPVPPPEVPRIAPDEIYTNYG